jgi:hypothetical protein
MSDNRSNGEFPIRPILIALALYLGYRIVQEIIRFVSNLLEGLLFISLGATAILVAFWLYRYITDKQYGQFKAVRELARWQKIKEQNDPYIPEDYRPQWEQFCADRQSECFQMNSHSRFDAGLDRTKQVLSMFRRRDK